VDPFLARGRACLALPAWASWKVRSHSPPATLTCSNAEGRIAFFVSSMNILVE
jgi:hypothetical protein